MNTPLLLQRLQVQKRRTHEVILEAKVIIKHLQESRTSDEDAGTLKKSQECFPRLLGRYLHVQRLTQTVHHQSGPLVPHRVQVLVDGLASEHLFSSQLELDIRVAGTCGYKVLTPSWNKSREE